ncbi:MAG: alpha-ketoglutarate-dependent dioxygenase AlkB [Polaromonas sp.]|nr:alpha-ketoglutarate-dependent dioxygenase AlkB [Polaromonas sp.]
MPEKRSGRSLAAAGHLQRELFEAPPPLKPLPPGLIYEEDFLSDSEEAALIALIGQLPLENARYKDYTARRRVLSYGGSFDYDANKLRPAQPLIRELEPLRDRVARWLDVAPGALVHALVAEYKPGTPLGWHRDVPDFEEVAGISLGSAAVLRFRPYPPQSPKRADIVHLPVAPRSIYRLSGAARWAWQHSVPPTPGLRWSITFRTAVARR